MYALNSSVFFFSRITSLNLKHCVSFGTVNLFKYVKNDSILIRTLFLSHLVTSLYFIGERMY